MIQRLTTVSTNCFSIRRTTGEHQYRLRRSMFSENRKHLALVLLAQVEKTVPCENSAEAPIERQFPHVCNYPVLPWELRLADINEIFRRVRSRYVASPLDEITSNGVSRSAPNVENRRASWQKRKKPVKHGLLEKVISSISGPIMSVSLIEAYYSISV